ncbi:MAG: tRNA (adenosine(37)-N6)-threonylcarbamoyltransferase complex ATPase subunit type 1 TsaE [Dysgonamonadaceae bacterium]|jgi:tRNA threonylcarbamoyladenosine biosynthesis protein TsaE|nr:tRNA (adenosine(37)-N6)-threonylcarbamoyltransferase complex ATPase subunit type 1 TsaE [Dysgonamonadaceae bacterium]
MKSIQIQHVSLLRQAAEAFVPMTANHRIFAFLGEMGVGKTTFIKAVCEVLGVEESINSPTFAIVNEYHSKTIAKSIFHFDFYRINSVAEALAIGIEDYFDQDALCFIEWPEKIEALLPEDTVFVRMTALPDDSRSLSFLSDIR